MDFVTFDLETHTSATITGRGCEFSRTFRARHVQHPARDLCDSLGGRPDVDDEPDPDARSREEEDEI